MLLVIVIYHYLEGERKTHAIKWRGENNLEGVWFK